MNIGFLSTRFAGTDGVSLESTKWAVVLEQMGHNCFWYSGLSDRDPAKSMVVPEAHFAHPDVEWISQRVWGSTVREREVTGRIKEQTEFLKDSIYKFVEKFSIDLMIPENAVTIPMNLPLGLAVTEFLAESGMPCIAHHHDFFWERTRFMVSGVNDILDTAFPPRLPKVIHTVINSAAQERVARRKGLGSHLIPNVFDFENAPPQPDDYSADVRQELGLEEDDIFILQPTRLVPRKGIEHAVTLVGMLKNPKCKLVISHDAGDEGYEYNDLMKELAEIEGVNLLIISDRVSEQRQLDAQGRKMYTLWDIYPHCDLVTFPSLYEGFGNALLEAVYFRKPVMLNRYTVFVEDIEPKGFKVATMNGMVTTNTLRQVEKFLSDKEYTREAVEHNYEVAKKHYSYEVLRQNFTHITTQFG